MGCDGGTIPKRKEVVKNKRTHRRERDRLAASSEKWKCCALSELLLRKPVMATVYGYLLNKEPLLEFLIEWQEDRLSAYHMKEDHPDLLGPVNNMKRVKELKLMDNPDAKSKEEASFDERWQQAEWVCPITGLETNGTHKFMFSWHCGCVVSERAIKEVPNDDKCLLCQTPYRPFDLVLINPSNKDDFSRNQAAFAVRELAKSLKEDDDLNLSNPRRKSSSSRKSAGNKTKRTDAAGPSTSDSSAPSTSAALCGSTKDQDQPRPSTSSSSTSSTAKRHASTSRESTKRSKI